MWDNTFTLLFLDMKWFVWNRLFACVYAAALAVCSEAYFSAVAKMGDQALHTLSSRSLGKRVSIWVCSRRAPFFNKVLFFSQKKQYKLFKKKKKQSPFLFFPIMSWFLCVTRVCISACLTSPITRWVNDGVRQQQILNQQVFVEGASVCSALASDRFGYIRRSGIHSLTTNPIEWLHLNHWWSWPFSCT